MLNKLSFIAQVGAALALMTLVPILFYVLGAKANFVWTLIAYLCGTCTGITGALWLSHLWKKFDLPSALRH